MLNSDSWKSIVPQIGSRKAKKFSIIIARFQLYDKIQFEIQKKFCKFVTRYRNEVNFY